MRRILLCLSITLVLAVPGVAQDPPAGTQPDVTITLADGNARQLRLAVPDAGLDNTASASLRVAAGDFDQTLRDDLDFAGPFRVQGPDELGVLTLTGNQGHDFEQYRSLGNDIVVLGRIFEEGDRFVLEGYVYDLPSGQSVFGKRYRGSMDQARRIAHTFADAIVEALTGEPGIALSALAFHSDRDGFQELYLMDYDGRNQRRITGHKSTSGFPNWSGTSDAIAYVSYFTEQPGVYYVKLPGGEKVPIHTSGNLNISPSISSDGQWVAFGHADAVNTDIFVCQREACSAPQQITKASGIDTNPAWSPDGSQIAFTSDRSGRPNVYVMERDGSNVRRISFDGNYNDGAAWHPEGTLIAYASRRGNRFQITVTDAVTLETRTLTSGPHSYEEPTWSPNGRYLAFSEKRGRSSQIWVIDSDGGAPRQLTFEGNNAAPDWSAGAL
ncbi:MAG: hypothetical protein AAGD38_05120 [Acidobacteriota bacterium]